MKKIGKNTKLYLIGMIIGGITLGITTVIADTIINSTSVAYKTTTVKAALDELYDIADFKEEVKDMLYPVGSIYISVSSTNPSELYGGTWESFGQGRTLLGVGALGTKLNSYTGDGVLNSDDIGWEHHSAEITGGERRHTLSLAELPKHRHEMPWWIWATSAGWTSGRFNIPTASNSNGNTDYYKQGSENQKQYTSYIGSDESHNNLPPYITVYMWKRLT